MGQVQLLYKGDRMTAEIIDKQGNLCKVNVQSPHHFSIGDPITCLEEHTKHEMKILSLTQGSLFLMEDVNPMKPKSYVEKRKHPRFKAHLHAFLVKDDGDMIGILIHDISQGGVKFSTEDDDIEVDGEYPIIIPYREYTIAPDVRIKQSTVCEDGMRFGGNFSYISDLDMSKLLYIILMQAVASNATDSIEAL